jgi:hypothetical protein
VTPAQKHSNAKHCAEAAERRYETHSAFGYGFTVYKQGPSKQVKTQYFEPTPGSKTKGRENWGILLNLVLSEQQVSIVGAAPARCSSCNPIASLHSINTPIVTSCTDHYRSRFGQPRSLHLASVTPHH